jgi:DNA repair protein RadA/Sms
MQLVIKQCSLYLLGGEPGIGKSTLLIQILQDLAANNKDMKIAYFTGEEQVSQISDRRHRLDPKRKNPIESISLFHATHIEDIVQTSKDNEYDMIIIDSIQTIYTSGNDSAPGSPNQVRFCTEKLSEFSSETQCTVFIIGHVTK